MARLSSGVRNRVSDAFSVRTLGSALEKCGFTNRVCRLHLKVRLITQNSVPERRRASLYSLKVIKMSRLTMDRFLILWSLHGSPRCCKTDREADNTTFLSLYRQDVRRGQFRCTRDPQTHQLVSASDRNHANRPNVRS